MLWVIINGVLASEEDQERGFFLFCFVFKYKPSSFIIFLKGNLSKTNDKCLNELHNLSQLTGIIVS